MRKILLLIVFPLLFISCNNDKDDVVQDKDLVKVSAIFATIDTVANYNGLLEIYSCIEGTTTYIGGYYNGKIMPFPAYYDVVNGIGSAENNPLTQTPGVYSLIFWGYPQYSNYNSIGSYVLPPGLRLGADLSTLYYTLASAGPTSADTLYNPVYDMVRGTQTINIATQEISTNLERETAGINIAISNSDSTAFSTAIDSMWIYISGISYKMNFATGETLPGSYKTISYGLNPTSGRAQFTTDSIYVFKSIQAPPFQLFVKLNTGTIKTYQSYLSKQLSPGTFTTLNINLNGILLSKNSTGSITIDSWTEQRDSITFPLM